MSTVQLSNVDLNLLVVMRVLLTTHSVKLAAGKLRVTPSAVSHALGRLRDLFGDPLFVREGQRVTPTALATELAEPIDRVLGEIESVLARKRRFDAKKLRRVFRLGTPDYAQLVVVPELLAILRDRAPSAELECQSPGLEVDALVRDRTLDAAIGSAFQPLPGLVIHKLYDDHLVLVAKKGGAPKGLEGYLAREHVVVSPRGQPGSIVDSALAAQHRTRKVVFRTPQFLAALHLCATSDLVTAVPSRLAEIAARTLPLEVKALPLAIAPFTVGILYSEIYRFDPAQLWFRAAIAEAVR